MGNAEQNNLARRYNRQASSTNNPSWLSYQKVGRARNITITDRPACRLLLPNENSAIAHIVYLRETRNPLSPARVLSTLHISKDGKEQIRAISSG